MTKQEKEELYEETTRILSGKFDAMDAVRFVQRNPAAWYLLRKCGFCEYGDELRFIAEHDDCEIRSVLEAPHGDYHDSYYGSLDPLCGFRVSSSDDIVNIEDYDNLFNHILIMLENEVVDIPKEEILTQDNLDMLCDGEADCDVDHIYYCEILGPEKFLFSYYFRLRNGGWDGYEEEYDLGDVEQLIRRIQFSSLDRNTIVREFYDYFRYYFQDFSDDAAVTENRPITEADIYNGSEVIRIIHDKMDQALRSHVYDIIEILRNLRYR